MNTLARTFAVLLGAGAIVLGAAAEEAGPQSLQQLLEFVKQGQAVDAQEAREREARFLADKAGQQAELERARALRAEQQPRSLQQLLQFVKQGQAVDAQEAREREVDVLRVGRIALLYQTPDRRAAGFWNPKQGGWEPLDGNEYRSAIQQGMRMANKQASIDLLTLPIAAPEVTR